MVALTFSVVTEAHLGLTETDGVLPLTDAIEFFQVCLVDTLNMVLVSKPSQYPDQSCDWCCFQLQSIPDWGSISLWP